MTELPEVMQAMNEEERRIFAYLWDTMPRSDRDNYPAELFARFARHAAMLRVAMPWCAALEENVFLDYVACHRVNDEDISFHREEFYARLTPRVQGMDVERAVLEVNRWCCEQATYRQRDDRTASPWTVYVNGVGRCGEESAFAVSALRSVGIPARQLYVPRWSHCDDNHAWVEALCNGEWRFFGACEPEPVLDKGWFNAAASRVVLAHSRRFAPPDAPVAALDGEALDRRGPAQYHNQTFRYARTRRRVLKVMKDGVPVQGAVVHLEVLNEAQLHPVLALPTAADGSVSVRLGKGDIYLRVEHEDGYAEQLCPAGEDTCAIELQPAYAPVKGWRDFDFSAPEGAGGAPALSEAQKEQRLQDLARGGRMREKKLAAYDETRAARLGEAAVRYLAAARSNFVEIAAFLERDDSPWRLALLGTLGEKDLYDTPAAVLEDHLRGALPYAAVWPRELFAQALLCPRIATEKLTPWREELAAAYSKEERQRYRREPQVLWRHLCQVQTLAGYPNLFWQPTAALRAQRWDEKSRALLFVALLRSWGLPARLRPEDGAPTWWNGERFVTPWVEETAVLTLQKQPEEVLDYRQSWSLARRTRYGWRTLALGDREWQEDRMKLALPQGRYRLLTAVRLPSGNQYAARYDVDLRGDETIPMRLRTYRMEDMLCSYTLPDFSAHTPQGEALSFPGHLQGGPSLLFWLQPGEEPTEHALNELLENCEGVRERRVRIIFLLPGEEAVRNATLARVLEIYPEITLLFGDWGYTLEICARSLYSDPESPPLAVCCGANGKAVYVSSGYNVGLVEMLLQILRTME